MKCWMVWLGAGLVSTVMGEEAPQRLDPALGAGLPRIETLRKSGEMRINILTRGGMTNVVMAYELAYQRPDRLLLNRRGTMLVADGTNVTIQGEMRELVRYATVPQTNLVSPLALLRGDEDVLLADLLALGKPDPTVALADFLREKNAVPLPDETFDDLPCHVLDVPVVVFDGRTLMARVWLDREWGLLRKMTSRWELKPGDDPESDTPMPVAEFVVTDLQINQPLADDTFTYTPPANARRMPAPDRLFMLPFRAQRAETMGKPAPEFTLPLLDGSLFRLADQTGKVVVIDFWATWCGPCVRALPEMKKLDERFAGREVVVVGVSSDRPDDAPKVRKVVADHELAYAIGIATNQIGTDYEVTGIPCLFVVDREGRIQHRHVGFHPDLANKIGAVVEQLLAGQTPEAPRAWTEDELAALAEEEAQFTSVGESCIPRPARVEPDTNAFRVLWRHTNVSERIARMSSQIDVAIPPATHTLLYGAELLVVDTEQGAVRHRILAPADCIEPDQMGLLPRHLFLPAADGGVAVFLRRQFKHEMVDGHARYQSTGAVLRAIDTNGSHAWSRVVDDDSRSLEVLPGPDGEGRLLVAGWNRVTVLDARGRTRWTQRLNPSQILRIEAGEDEGSWDLLLGASNPGRYRWIDPPPVAQDLEDAP